MESAGGCQSNDRESVGHWIVRSHPSDSKVGAPSRLCRRQLNEISDPGGEERKNEDCV